MTIKEPNTMAHRAEDGNAPVKISREIPLPWLVTMVAALAFQAVTLYLGQQDQSKQLQALAIEVRELRSSVNAGSLKTVEHDVKLADHDRRITQLEQQRSKP